MEFTAGAIAERFGLHVGSVQGDGAGLFAGLNVFPETTYAREDSY